MPSKERTKFRLEAGRIRMQEVIPFKKQNRILHAVKSVRQAAGGGGHRGQACVLALTGQVRIDGRFCRGRTEGFSGPWRIPSRRGGCCGEAGGVAFRVAGDGAWNPSGTYGGSVRAGRWGWLDRVHRVSAKAVKDQPNLRRGSSSHDGRTRRSSRTCARGQRQAVGDGLGRRHDQEIRYWVRRVDAAQRVKQMWGGKIEALLARHWPEATRLMPRFERDLIQGAACTGAAPARWRATPMRQRSCKASAALLSEAKIASIVGSAKASGGVRMNAWETKEVQELAGRSAAAERDQRLQSAACGR